MWTLANRAVGIAVLGAILCGCSAASRELMPRHMGFRPDEPAPGGASTCEEYRSYVKYAQQLQESYHSRATQNRWWIYVAGVIGLGTVAAAGGLAAATAVGAGTLALLSISGGFSSGAFATLANATLADMYTIAANRVDTALTEADALLPFAEADSQRPVAEPGAKTANASRYTNDAKCGEALVRLKGLVSEARTKLERARTDSAVAAVERAVAQQQGLRQLSATVLEGDPTVVVRKAEITAIDRTTGIKKGDTKVHLTVANIRLGGVPRDDLKVIVGNREIDVSEYITTSLDVWQVSFDAPDSPPQSSKLEYAPALLVGRSKQRVESRADVILRYENPSP